MPKPIVTPQGTQTQAGSQAGNTQTGQGQSAPPKVTRRKVGGIGAVVVGTVTIVTCLAVDANYAQPNRAKGEEWEETKKYNAPVRSFPPASGAISLGRGASIVRPDEPTPIPLKPDNYKSAFERLGERSSAFSPGPDAGGPVLGAIGGL